MIFEHKYNEKVVKKNIDFYRKHFTNSLNNLWIQSIIPRTERLNLSITQFNKVTSLKRNSLLVGEKGFDIGACALVYYVLVYSYAGLRKQNQYFSVDTNIPGNIRRLEFWINYKDHLADIKIKRNSARLEWRKED
jgi:trehalose/maltose hydrolase-like predicted phosphorylase